MGLKKEFAFKLAVLLPVLIISIGLLTTTAFALGSPLVIYGYVTVNGTPTSGVTVNDGAYGDVVSTGNSGYYQLGPSVSNGSSVTVTATHEGYTALGHVTQSNQGYVELDLSISMPVATPTSTPTTTTTATPSASPTSSPCTIALVLPLLVVGCAAGAMYWREKKYRL